MDQTKMFQDTAKAIRLHNNIESKNPLGKYRAKSSIFFKEASNVVNEICYSLLPILHVSLPIVGNSSCPQEASLGMVIGIVIKEWYTGTANYLSLLYL